VTSARARADCTVDAMKTTPCVSTPGVVSLDAIVGFDPNRYSGKSDFRLVPREPLPAMRLPGAETKPHQSPDIAGFRIPIDPS
jgi:hypothetical protein